MRKNLLIIIVFVLATFLTGCVTVLVGGAGVAGGYALTRDSISGYFDKDFDTIWFKAEEVLNEEGEIISGDDQAGKIIGMTTKGVKVTISLSRVTEKTTQITVKARKKVLAKQKEAQRIFNTIIRRITA